MNMDNRKEPSAGSQATSQHAELDVQAFQLFSQSLDMPGGEGEVWLRQQCAGNDALRQRVEQLQRADQDSSGFLETPALWQPLPDHSGVSIGAYELVSILAHGGMGTVYTGRRNDGAFEQQVAIKLFNPNSLTGASRARFAAERNILAALEHPGIARIIDGGDTDDGIPYVVMELIQGQTINVYCEHQQLDVPERLRLIVKLCDALQHAHACGVVHRDIKADNVLVTEQGEPKLIDFGIAKMQLPEASAEDDAAAPPSRNLTSRLMTPEYASPEQLRGEPAMPASDLYSMGVLMYELLTGTRPHHIAGMSPAEMERMVCQTIPQDPSKAIALSKSAPPAGLGSAMSLRRELTGDLDRIMMTALRLEPIQRYATAAALASDIKRYLAGQPVTASGASRFYRARKFVQRHRPVVVVTLTAFALLLAVLLQLAVQVKEARIQRDIAVDQATQAAQAKDFLVSMIGRADPFENADAPTLAGALRQAVSELDDRFAGQPELEADMRYAVGYALQNLGEIPLARSQLEQALALRRAGDDPLRLAQAHDGMGIVCWWESDFDCADQQFAQALTLLEPLPVDNAEALAVRINTLSNRAAMQIDHGRYHLSRQHADAALALATQHHYDDKETLAATWLNLATALEGLEQNDAALNAFDNALMMQRELTGTMHPSYAVILNNLALYHYKLGDNAAAVEALTESVNIRRETLGSAHPQTATALFNLARVLINTGDLETALDNAKEALRVARLGYAENHPRIGKAHEALALVYQAMQRPAPALQHAEQASSIYHASNDVDPAWVASVRALIDEISQQQHAPESGTMPPS